MKQITREADLSEEVKVLQSLNISVQKPAALVTHGAPSTAGKNIGVSWHVTSYVRNKTDINLRRYHC
jgi:hypothetical protein